MSAVFLASALGRGEWSALCLSLLIAREEPLLPIKQRAEMGGVSQLV